MNGLREASRVVFEEQKFQTRLPSSHTYEVAEITTLATGEARHYRRHLGPQRLAEYAEHTRFHYNPPRDTVESRLKMIYFSMSRDHTLHTDRALFARVFRAFNLEEYMLFMITRDVTGFHYLGKHTTRTSGPDRGRGLEPHNFWLSNISYMILWSYDARTLSTNAIVIMRGKGGRTAVGELQAIMEQHDNLLCSPFFLPFVVTVQLMSFSHAFVTKQLQEIRQVEKKTGCNPWSPEVLKMDVSGPEPFKHLSRLSETMSNVLVGLEDLLRHLGLARSLVRHFDGPKIEKLWANLPNSFHDRPAVRASRAAIVEALKMLDPQITSGILSIEFLQKRARNQNTVIFSMITRGDALAGINLAQSAKDDGFSMKVIAVMTMAFLPGTFFAALFSLPTLQWDSTPVIQTNFWFFWAFTLPSTCFIFALWFMATNRQMLESNFAAWLCNFTKKEEKMEA